MSGGSGGITVRSPPFCGIRIYYDAVDVIDGVPSSGGADDAI